MIIPNSAHRHSVFDASPAKWDENIPSPWSRERLDAFQERLNAIGGVAWNGKPNVRICWPAWPVPCVTKVAKDPGPILDYDESITMHWVKGADGKFWRRGRYRLFTQEYDLEGINLETGLPVVQQVDVDICLRRFVVEEYHVPEEGRFNPKTGAAGHGFYSHLWSVGVHFDSCCGGNEATKRGKLCLGLYREPAERDLEELARRIKARDAWEAGHRPGEQVSTQEMMLDARNARSAEQADSAKRLEVYRQSLMDGFASHGWRMFCDDPTKLSHGKYHFLKGPNENN